jgi:hypothetical protein
MCITKVKTSSREEWLKMKERVLWACGACAAAVALLAVLGYIF